MTRGKASCGPSWVFCGPQGLTTPHGLRSAFSDLRPMGSVGGPTEVSGYIR